MCGYRIVAIISAFQADEGSSNLPTRSKIMSIGVWRSWLARTVWDREVVGSSPTSPTMSAYGGQEKGEELEVKELF